MKERLDIPVKVCDLGGTSFFEDDVSKIIENLQVFQTEYRGCNLYIVCDGWYEYPDYSLWYTRKETDQEYNKRIKREQTEEERKLEQQKKKAEAEFKKYQKLKEKYEKANS
jgi:hypothetical protein